MNPSVSLEAERELIDGALFYAREANAELGLAFIAEFERTEVHRAPHPGCQAVRAGWVDVRARVAE